MSVDQIEAIGTHILMPLAFVVVAYLVIRG